MKKIFSALLILVLMFGCGIGGFFLRDLTYEKKFDIAVAKTTISKIAHNAEWVNDAETSESGVKNANYSNYEGTVIDYNGKDAFVKTFGALLFYAVDGEVRASTNYISSATYRIGSVDVEGKMSFYIELTEKQAYFYLKDLINKITMVMMVSSENNTTDNYQIDGYMTGTFSATQGMVYFTICSDDEKITRFAYSEVEWNGEVNNVDDITDESIREITVFDCNLKNGRTLKKGNHYNNITPEEKVDYATKTMEQFYQVKLIDVVYKDFVKVDFLEKAYKDLGYEVIS